MSVKRVEPDEAARLVDRGWSYLDVRTEAEFAAGHPSGAFNIVGSRFDGDLLIDNPDFAVVAEASFPKDSQLVIGCRSGGRSLMAAKRLIDLGYTEIVDMRGGFGGERDESGAVVVAGWSERGLPVADSPQPGRSYLELLARAKSR